jgi:hypothetical protein
MFDNGKPFVAVYEPHAYKLQLVSTATPLPEHAPIPTTLQLPSAVEPMTLPSVLYLVMKAAEVDGEGDKGKM